MIQVAASIRFSHSPMGADLHMVRPTAVRCTGQSIATRYWVGPLQEVQAAQEVAQGTVLVAALEEEAQTMSRRHRPTPFLNLRGPETFPRPGRLTPTGLIIPKISQRGEVASTESRRNSSSTRFLTSLGFKPERTS